MAFRMQMFPEATEYEPQHVLTLMVLSAKSLEIPGKLLACTEVG